ncbi:hypothetical protein Q5E55_020410 (plasmid) [Acinetobacter baumannii]
MELLVELKSNKSLFTNLLMKHKRKIKNNIFVILKHNEILTKGELELIKDKMVNELDQMQKSGYREMIDTNNSLSEDKLDYINGIKIDIELIKLIISKNEII